MSLRFNVKSLA
ncbi:hypothetical protein FQN60_001402 [Etheostoma spectabile]|uniref:Uncharacterized protein n=1 Tax=Etheostoma spectabile TaxID=54343 RepID=A0A5J5D0D0_9PERO|nr:hypothetical protein FQN60_001402 [Etheostoma spectabile]